MRPPHLPPPCDIYEELERLFRHRPDLYAEIVSMLANVPAVERTPFAVHRRKRKMSPPSPASSFSSSFSSSSSSKSGDPDWDGRDDDDDDDDDGLGEKKRRRKKGKGTPVPVFLGTLRVTRLTEEDRKGFATNLLDKVVVDREALVSKINSTPKEAQCARVLLVRNFNEHRGKVVLVTDAGTKKWAFRKGKGQPSEVSLAGSSMSVVRRWVEEARLFEVLTAGRGDPRAVFIDTQGQRDLMKKETVREAKRLVEAMEPGKLEEWWASGRQLKEFL